MGRWTQYDEDDYRLPEGMKRVGYDADTGKYYFRDRDGTLWEGPEGAHYGELTKVNGNVVVEMNTSEDDEDLEAASGRSDGYQPLAADADSLPRKHRADNTSAYRTLFPFLMMIIVFLLLIIRLLMPSHQADSRDPIVEMCKGYAKAYRVQVGDTCWDIGRRAGVSVEQLKEANPGLECKLLTPSEIICLPEGKTRSGSGVIPSVTATA